jgi:hypothetical protein
MPIDEGLSDLSDVKGYTLKKPKEKQITSLLAPTSSKNDSSKRKTEILNDQYRRDNCIFLDGIALGTTENSEIEIEEKINLVGFGGIDTTRKFTDGFEIAHALSPETKNTYEISTIFVYKPIDAVSESYMFTRRIKDLNGDLEKAIEHGKKLIGVDKEDDDEYYDEDEEYDDDEW